MEYYVDLDKLKNIGEDLIHHAKSNIRPKYDELLALLDEFVWEGDACNVYKKNYTRMIKRVLNMEFAIVKLGAFLVTCSENYGETEKQIITKWQENVNLYLNDENY